MKKDLALIAVEPKPKLNDLNLWQSKLETVKTLTSFCKIVTWATKDNSGYVNMPYVYSYRGITIEFLPHWKSMKIGKEIFIDEAGIDEAKIKRAISLIKQLKELGAVNI